MDLRKRGLTYSEIAKKMNRSLGAIDHALRGSSKIKSRFFDQFDQSSEEIEKNQRPQETQEVGAKVCGSGDSLTAESTTKDIRTLEQLIDRCEIDLNKWSVETWRANVWQVGVKGDDGHIYKENLYQVKANLKKIPITIKDIEDLFNSCSIVSADKAPYRRKKKGGKLLEISIPDIHLGKLCWSEETGGENYDTNEAVARFKDAIDDLVTRIKPEDVSEILLPLGNDMLNTDGKENETSNGTPQAEDSRWQKSFKKACELCTWAINRCLEVAPVNVLIVPGNHDQERSYYLGCFLEAMFSGRQDVEINNAPTERKYRRFGNTLIGFTHGDRIKLKDLIALAQNEQRKAWGESKYCEWHLGHLHRESVMEDGGVIARVIPSLCPPDAWHAKHGYVMAIPAAQAFVYDDESGLESIFYHRVG